VSQGEYWAGALQRYFVPHPAIEESCTKGGHVHYLTTENPEKFKESAQIFLHEPVEVDNITLA
jgi:glutamate racemase